MTNKFKWTCRNCNRLLGVIDDDRLEITMARGHQYRVTLPASCVCPKPGCRTLNELRPGALMGDASRAPA